MSPNYAFKGTLRTLREFPGYDVGAGPLNAALGPTSESMEQPADAYLWTSGEWIVQRCTEVRAHVQVQFRPGGPTAAEVSAVRSLCFPTRAAADVLSALRGKSSFPLGSFRASEADQLKERAEALGLAVHVVHAESVSYTPVRKDGSAVLLIENDEEARRVIEEMVRHGVPIIEASGA